MKNVSLLLLLFFITITKTYACSCIESNKPLSEKVKEAFTKSSVIISGKVIDIKTENSEEDSSSFDPIIYKFEVIQSFKGKIEKTIIEIVSVASEASCGYIFELGQSYLVYASKTIQFSSSTNNEFDFFTSLCDRNQVLTYVEKEETRKLKKLKRKAKD